MISFLSCSWAGLNIISCKTTVEADVAAIFSDISIFSPANILYTFDVSIAMRILSNLNVYCNTHYRILQQQIFDNIFKNGIINQDQQDE